MPSKCKAIKDAELDIDQAIQDNQSYIDETQAQNADPNVSPQHQKFTQSLIGKAKKILEKKSTMSNPQDVMTDKDVNPIIKKHFKTSEERERVTLVHQITTLMNNDIDFSSVADEIIIDTMKNTEFAKLRNEGRPIVIDELTNKPNLYTVPLPKIRTIYKKLAPFMDITEEGKARGLHDSNLAFEFFLPKSVLKSAGTRSSIKFKHSLYRWRNKVNALVSSYSGPINIDSRTEKILVHDRTKLPIIQNLTRGNAGFTQIMNVLSKSLYFRLKSGHNQSGKSQIKDRHEMFAVVSDLMHGKAFIVDKGDSFGKVYMFEREVPMGKYEDTGDIKHEWKGREFTNEERLAIEKKTGKPFKASSYVIPYMTNKTDRDPEGQHLNFNEDAGDGQSLAMMVDSTLQHMDTILREAGENFQEGLLEKQLKWQQLLAEAAKRKIDLPEDIFGASAQLDEDITALNSQNARLKEKVQFRSRLALQDGTFVEVRRFNRYYPTLYYNHAIGDALISGISNIDSELSLLRFRSTPNPEGTDEQRKVIRNALNRSIELEKAKRHLEIAYEKYKNSDSKLEKDDTMPAVMQPFEKHFKSLSHFIDYSYRRNDIQVVNDYINRLSKTDVKAGVMLDMLEAYLDTDNPSYRNYLLNQYKKAFGSLDAEGSIAGFRFSTRDLASLTPFDAEQMKKFFNGLKSASVFNNLSGIWTGPLNMVAHVNKMFEVGAGRFVDAFADAQLEVNQKAIIKSGILSFQDVIENQILTNGNAEEKRQYKLQKIKWKKRKKNARSLTDKQIATDILYLMKKNNNPIMYNIRALANWAISGEMAINIDDSEAKKIAKSVLNLKKYTSMSLSEKSVRQTSCQIGVNIAVEGWGVSPDSDLAQDMGIRMVEELDFSLGQEGVGDMFGNELMQWLMHIRVWSTQRMAYGKDSYIDAWNSVKPYSDVETTASKFKNNSKASWEYTKALMTTMMGSGALLSSPLIGGLAVGAQTGNLISGIGGAIAGLGVGYGIRKISNAKEKQNQLRIDNPDLAKASQMLLFHGTMALLYDFVVFNNNMDFGKLAGFFALFKKLGFKTGTHKFGSSLAGPELRFGFMALAMLFKATKEDEELDRHDFVKLVGSAAGLGYMQIMYLILSLFEDQNSLVKQKELKSQNYGDQFLNLNFPKILKTIGLDGAKTKDLVEDYILNRKMAR